MVWSKIIHLIHHLRQKPQSAEGFFLVLLGLILVWSWIFWQSISEGPTWLIDRSQAICYPFFPQCQNWDPWSVLSFAHWNDLMAIAGLLGIISSVFRRFRAAQILIATGFAVKLLIFLLDFRLMGNYHVIGFYFAALILLRPSPSALQLMFCLIYFFAGLLKLNVEWVSGDALYGQIPGLHHDPLVFASGFVVVLELVGSWLLLSRDQFLRWTAWSLFVVFHLLSVYVVGFFYPAVMLTLLAFFPFCWQREWNFAFRDLKVPVLVFFATMITLQLLPLTVKYPSLTGEARILALNMFDAKARCQVTMSEKSKGSQVREIENSFRYLGYRIGCDPYLYFTHIKKLCAKDPQTQISLFMQIRGNHDLYYPVTINEPNMCREEISYSWWKQNPWIQISSGPFSGVHSSVSLFSLFPWLGL